MSTSQSVKKGVTERLLELLELRREETALTREILTKNHELQVAKDKQTAEIVELRRTVREAEKKIDAVSEKARQLESKLRVADWKSEVLHATIDEQKVQIEELKKEVADKVHELTVLYKLSEQRNQLFETLESDTKERCARIERNMQKLEAARMSEIEAHNKRLSDLQHSQKVDREILLQRLRYQINSVIRDVRDETASISPDSDESHQYQPVEERDIGIGTGSSDVELDGNSPRPDTPPGPPPRMSRLVNQAR